MNENIAYVINHILWSDSDYNKNGQNYDYILTSYFVYLAAFVLSTYSIYAVIMLTPFKKFTEALKPRHNRLIVSRYIIDIIAMVIIDLYIIDLYIIDYYFFNI